MSVVTIGGVVGGGTGVGAGVGSGTGAGIWHGRRVWHGRRCGCLWPVTKYLGTFELNAKAVIAQYAGIFTPCMFRFDRAHPVNPLRSLRHNFPELRFIGGICP
jgi:hypothetical protein